MKTRTALALPLAAALAGCGVNSVPTAQENAKAKWGDVEVQFQRRANLIPNLVATVKASGAQEKDILVGIAQARAQASQLHLSGDDLTDPEKVHAVERAQTNITTGVRQLQEAYPNLKSQDNYQTLMSQIEGAENRIEIALNDYNAAVQQYNTTIRTFPAAIGAKVVYGAKPMVPFTATTQDTQNGVAPTVNFGNAS